MERHLKIIILFSAAVILQSCGVYGFRGNNPPKGINSIAVPVFDDVSGFAAPTLAKDFTQLMKDRIIIDNTFRIADKNIADGLLKCTIITVKDEALVISAGENVTKRKITITVRVLFEDLDKQKKIWEKNFENYGEYASSNFTFSERAAGIEIAVDRITEDILIELTSNW